MTEIAAIKLSSAFVGRNITMTNHMRVKRFEDGNAFISVKNGWDKIRDKERNCCIVLTPEQIAVLREFLK